MSSAKITLIGMAKWFESHQDSLFKNLTVPDGIDKDTLTDNIILRGAEFEVLYSNADFFQEAIGVWSKKMQRTFDKWVKALSVEYNPLENYDRIEDTTDKNSGTVKNTGTQGALSKISAFNSDTMADNESSERTDNLTQTNDLTLKHDARIHGNIGVTTSQQMLQSELDIAKWNLYDQITYLFLTEFVIPIY